MLATKLIPEFLQSLLEQRKSKASSFKTAVELFKFFEDMPLTLQQELIIKKKWLESEAKQQRSEE